MNAFTMNHTLSNQTIDLPNEAATAALATRIANHINAGDVVYLQGELGAGKTTFTRHFAAALGVTGRIKSPTYTLVESYELEGKWAGTTLHHFDLYRIGEPREWFDAGFDEYINSNTITLIEWPSQADGALPAATIELNFEHTDNTTDVSSESFDGARRVKMTLNPLKPLP